MMIKRPLSLVARIGLWVSLMVTVLWIGAAVVTVQQMYHEVNEGFDRDLRTAADRILPIVLHEHFDDHEDDRPRDLGRLDHSDDVEFQIIRDRSGLLLRSEGAKAIDFPTRTGFSDGDGYRFYVAPERRGAVIAVARPLDARQEILHTAITAFLLPLLFVVPLTLVAIYYAVRRGLVPLGLLRKEIETRGPANLTPVDIADLPRELKPMVDGTNRMMERLNAGFAAERDFAANAAHELRTPVAGAIAQAQRLQAESKDTVAVARAKEIETTLKRLNRYAEKLMQMARAEGAKLRVEEPMDAALVIGMIVDDFKRTEPELTVRVSSPDTAVMTDLDPDALGIVVRNLIENALRYRTEGTEISVTLDTDHRLTVANDCPVVDAEKLARLSQRFMRGGGAGDGTGLGLSIVHIIAERSNAQFSITSPRSGSDQGCEATFTF